MSSKIFQTVKIEIPFSYQINWPNCVILIVNHMTAFLVNCLKDLNNPCIQLGSIWKFTYDTFRVCGHTSKIMCGTSISCICSICKSIRCYIIAALVVVANRTNKPSHLSHTHPDCVFVDGFCGIWNCLLATDSAVIAHREPRDRLPIPVYVLYTYVCGYWWCASIHTVR